MAAWMLRDGDDPDRVAAVTDVPFALVELIAEYFPSRAACPQRPGIATDPASVGKGLENAAGLDPSKPGDGRGPCAARRSARWSTPSWALRPSWSMRTPSARCAGPCCCCPTLLCLSCSCSYHPGHHPGTADAETLPGPWARRTQAGDLEFAAHPDLRGGDATGGIRRPWARRCRFDACPARRRPHQVTRVTLARTYVILVLPKCLLTWGYVKLMRRRCGVVSTTRRLHGESAGSVEI